MFEAVWAWCDVFFGRQPGWPEVIGLVVLVVALAASVSLRVQGLVQAVTRGPRGVRVALTFDDGPDPALTPKVLEILERHGVRATFFLLGERAEVYPELVQRLKRAGHEVGNHGFTHKLSDLWSPAKAHQALGRTQEVLTSALGDTPRLYRPVYGLALPGVALAVRRLGLQVVGWSLRTRDGTGLGSPEARAAWTLDRVRGGSIVLMHDGPSFAGDPTPHGPAMLETLLVGLKARGLEPVTVSELMGWR
jgi:peptidoglycan/xylan/chitin deacetylase (PgdA/CDA1 family)